MNFEPVKCPRCEHVFFERSEGSVFTGIDRIKCPTCKHRIWLGGSGDGLDLKTVQIDTPARRLRKSA